MDDPDEDRTADNTIAEKKDTRCVRFAARSLCPFVLPPSGAAFRLSRIAERK